MIDVIAQVMIMVFGVLAIGLSQQHNPKLRKWAPVVGLITQPAWFYTTYTHEQWGIFIVSFIYASMWALGFYNQWIKVEEKSGS